MTKHTRLEIAKKRGEDYDQEREDVKALSADSADYAEQNQEP